MLKTAARVYRKNGVRGLVAAGRSKLGLEPEFQEKAGLEERLVQLDRGVPADAGSLVDIGCNQGRITTHFADKGIVSLGIDISPKLIAQARRLSRDKQNCGFMTMRLTPENVWQLPEFDVVLLLSVHHNWVAEHGPEVGAEMLRQVATKARRTLVFEGPARRGRFGPHPPDFVDNDEESVTGYISGYLSEHLSDQFAVIEPLGRTVCWGEGDREPYRWAWALHRS